jgi:ketosteroid isomerase-like protein
MGWLVLAAAGVAGCQPAPEAMSDAERQAVAQEVRAQVDSLTATLEQLNAQRYLDQLAINESYAENGVVYPTRDSLLSAVGHFTSMFKSIELAWEGDPRITVLGPDAAVFSGAYREVAQPTTGTAMRLHGVWTVVYQRTNGRWGIVQGHESWIPDQPAPKK